MELIIRLILFVSAGATFACGACKFFTRKTALFKILVTASTGCFMLGKLYELVMIFTSGSIPSGFNIGMLASIGAFMFIFSASYAQMDGLVDERSKALAKYRVIALAAPAAIMAIYIPIALSGASAGLKITSLLVFISIAMAGYYNLKHFIIPDVSFGIIASIRGYSLDALILGILSAVQITLYSLDKKVLWAVVSVLIAAVYPCILISMDRGSRQWTL